MSQRSLFDDTPEWDVDAAREVNEVPLATVVFPDAPPGTFDYRIPDRWLGILKPGMRVRVPLGGRKRPTLACCVATGTKPEPKWKLREIAEIVDPQPLLSPAMLRVTYWMAEHYLCPWGQVLEAIVPAGVRRQAGTREIVLLRPAASPPTESGMDTPSPPTGALPSTGPTSGKSLTGPGKPRPITPLQRKVLDFLRSCGGPATVAQICDATGCGEGVVRTLVSRRWVERFTQRIDTAALRIPKLPKTPPYPLTDDQRRTLEMILESLDSSAVARISGPITPESPHAPGSSQTPGTFTGVGAPEVSGTFPAPAIPRTTTASGVPGEFRIGAPSPPVPAPPVMPTPILVHGVTGSGKTEVYIRAIEEVVRRGKQAIVLVPEISLTPQTVARFRGRFDHVAILHSHLTDSERHREWKRIVSGEVQVVVGARSAVFAPVPDPGMIILDEEHESSFKQETAPRYHARDVAIRRAQEEGTVLVLGSATPSLESWNFARQRKFRLASMLRRVAGRPMPVVQTIDLREALPESGPRGAISRPLYNAMWMTLRDDDRNQIILLLNRRGYSTHIQCPQCGYVANCPHCDIAMTFHQQRGTVVCHYCDYETDAPRTCPECRYGGIRYSGFGTEKLEWEISRRFPGIETIRMDTDTMRRPGAHEAALTEFREGRKRILLGTQMIAKGLDFPNVTLVGIINADTALHLPDFRASERTFCLVTQVAGRTGRGERGGRVLLQTFSPDHDAIAAAVHHDYLRFAEKELPLREQFGYPPYARMLRLVIRGPVEETTQ
ncbi:MAG: primosomal protein N', partial [Planctomycetia bacterium]|nr:primosomal protein N' [Planctomycetia bacterium]